LVIAVALLCAITYLVIAVALLCAIAYLVIAVALLCAITCLSTVDVVSEAGRDPGGGRAPDREERQ
jgi:hypothetical protein